MTPVLKNKKHSTCTHNKKKQKQIQHKMSETWVNFDPEVLNSVCHTCEDVFGSAKVCHPDHNKRKWNALACQQNYACVCLTSTTKAFFSTFIGFTVLVLFTKKRKKNTHNASLIIESYSGVWFITNLTHKFMKVGEMGDKSTSDGKFTRISPNQKVTADKQLDYLQLGCRRFLLEQDVQKRLTGWWD